MSDRLPPHATDAERGILGCCLLDPIYCIPQVISYFNNWDSDFLYEQRHKLLYELLLELYNQNALIDLVVVRQKLLDRNQLNSAGGLEYLAELPDATPGPSNLVAYLPIVREKYLLRRVLQVCTEVVGRVRDFKPSEEYPLEKFMDGVEKDILAVNEIRSPHATPPIKELVRAALKTIEDAHDRKGQPAGIPTGFIDLDKMTNGLHPQDMIVLAGRPSTGKSTLAMNIVDHVAIDQKAPVGVFSLEMSAASLVLRMLYARARINSRNVNAGFLAERDFPKITNAAGKLAGAPIYIDDTAGLSILALRAKARRMWQQHGIKLFVIDYLQLLCADNRTPRQQQIAEISSGIKTMAKELGVPVIVLSQLNREVEKDGRKPRMSDLRESGAIEQDADLIGMLYKADPENRRKAARDSDSDDPPDGGVAIPVNLIIPKQRSGPTGEVYLTFCRSITRFENAAKISNDDLPGIAHGSCPKDA